MARVADIDSLDVRIFHQCRRIAFVAKQRLAAAGEQQPAAGLLTRSSVMGKAAKSCGANASRSARAPLRASLSADPHTPALPREPHGRYRALFRRERLPILPN